MIRVNRVICALACGAALTAMALSAYAGSWQWAKPYQGPDKDIITLVITSNYTKPRLLADLIQYETKQPYILLPAGGKGKIYFCPARKRPALEVSEKQLAKFIKFVNPKQVLVLGDKKYVPEKYLKMIDKKQTVWIVSNENWQESAESINKMLDTHNLATDFKRLSAQIDSGQLYKPIDTEKGQDVDLDTTVETTDIQVDGEAIVTPAAPPAAIAPAVTPIDTAPAPVVDKTAEPPAANTDKTKPAEPAIVVPKEDPVLIEDTNPLIK